MTKEQIDTLMQEAGIVVVGEAVYKLCQLVAAAGRADENEACAKVCDWVAAEWKTDSKTAIECASAIRARREQ